MEAKNEKIRQQFSHRLKSEFKRVGLPISSPTQIANEFNRLYPLQKVATQTVRKWLLADAIPTQARLLAVAEWLNVSPQWLRFGMGARTPSKRNDVSTSTETEVLVRGEQRSDLVPVVELCSLLSSSNMKLVENIVGSILETQSQQRP